ncbi:MAG: alcohol dehydrogenase [Frankiales bacterium]|nr:alcohol dehydrogenase [Frankiales bacterium]
MLVTSVVLSEAGRPRPYTASKPVEVRELTLERPRAGELLVRVEASGLCHSDLSVVDGSRPRPLPMALGHEAAGIVEEIGDGVHDVAVGDRVVLVFVPSCGSCPECSSGSPALCRRGAASNTAGELLRGGTRLSDGVHHHLGVSAFSSHVVVDRGSAVVVPPEVQGQTAALFGCALLTGTGAVESTVQVRPGDSVVVVGLGGVGLSAVMGAHLAGADPLIVVDPVAAKRSLAMELGATHVASSVEEVRDLTGGGARYVIEAVGHEQAMADAFAMTARGGATVLVGLPHPSRMLSIPAVQVVAEARQVLGSYMGSAAPQRDIPRLVGLWQSGRLPVERLTSAVLSLEDAPAALDALADGVAVRQLLIP